MVADLSNVPISDLATAIDNIDFGGKKGINAGNPALAQDIMTKSVFDAHVSNADAHHTNHETAQGETAEFRRTNLSEILKVHHIGVSIIEQLSLCAVGDAGYAEGRAYDTTRYYNCFYFNFKRSRNESYVTTTTLDGDYLGCFNFQGVNNSNIFAGAGGFRVDQDGVATAYVGGRMHFFVTNRLTGVSSTKFNFSASGVAFGASAPASLFDFQGDRIRISTAKTPSSAGDTGVIGEICWDTNYIYVCIATNTWKRTALNTW